MNNTVTFENSLISLSYLGKMILVDYKKSLTIAVEGNAGQRGGGLHQTVNDPQ